MNRKKPESKLGILDLQVDIEDEEKGIDNKIISGITELKIEEIEKL